MDFLFNDASVHGQFATLDEFCDAVSRLMALRHCITQSGSSLFCNRNLAETQVTASQNMRQAVQALSREQRRAWMRWLTREGPHWEDHRVHHAADYFEAEHPELHDPVVTDTAIGEAAYGLFQKPSSSDSQQQQQKQLVSMLPSRWDFSPVRVRWHRSPSASSVDAVDVPNHVELKTLQKAMAASRPSVRELKSWESLEARMRASCTQLSFVEDAFAPTRSYPFSPGVAERIEALLHTLNRMKRCFDTDGERTPEGDRLYMDHCTGKKAWFTGASSSETNNKRFRQGMTFRHPEDPAKTLFCPWHGKIKIQQYRIHFSGPPSADEPLYIVYVGPKITKK